MKNSIVLFTFIIVFVSCKKISDKSTVYYPVDNGFFILNEGNFTQNNGTLSFFSYDDQTFNNDLFNNNLSRKLGDVPFSMSINSNNGYIVVNNSGKIEVVTVDSLTPVKTITGLVSPRYITSVSNNKAYLTSLYLDSLTIINTDNNTISGYINIRRTSEAIVVTGNKAFVSNWVGGNEIMVINTENNEVIDSIIVGDEPESMVIDANNELWVLCSGKWTNDDFAKLIKIDVESCTIEKEYVFASELSYPSCLKISADGETIYYLDNGICKMSIDSETLPATPLIGTSEHYFYDFGINPGNNDIVACDAFDYSSNGTVVIYNSEGVELLSGIVGITPGFICFKPDDTF